MKMRSVFSSTQEQSFFSNKPVQRAISPNKTFHSHQNQNGYTSVNNSFNYKSSQNFFDTTQNGNTNNFINLPAPKIKQAITINNDRPIQTNFSVKSPVTFSDETLNKTQSTFILPKKIYLIASEISFK